jgi:hypothetical protein
VAAAEVVASDSRAAEWVTRAAEWVTRAVEADVEVVDAIRTMAAPARAPCL